MRMRSEVSNGLWLRCKTTVLMAGVLLAGCAEAPIRPTVPQASRPSPPQAALPSPQHASPQQLQAHWWVRGQDFVLPGKRRTHYHHTHLEGRPVLHARSAASASMWRHPLRLPASQLGRMHFSWMVPKMIAGADLSRREGDDTPVRIVLAFDGDPQRLNAGTRMMFELAETLTGEPPPFATLMYVWAPHAAPLGSVIHAPRSDRVRSVVVESGARRLGQWLRYERDVVADFRAAYGEDPGELIGIAVMTDSDNTGTEAEAFYGPIELWDASRRRLL
jgi:hypothetical protein